MVYINKRSCKSGIFKNMDTEFLFVHEIIQIYVPDSSKRINIPKGSNFTIKCEIIQETIDKKNITFKHSL